MSDIQRKVLATLADDDWRTVSADDVEIMASLRRAGLVEQRDRRDDFIGAWLPSEFRATTSGRAANNIHQPQPKRSVK